VLEIRISGKNIKFSFGWMILCEIYYLWKVKHKRKKDMATVKAKYLGNLRLECTHLQSGTKIITDAPTDNNGKGEAFSPTDLCSTSLAACAMTIMGIYAKNNGIDLTGAEIEITKKMAAEPRRIAEIDVIFNMPANGYSEKEKKILERVAHTCPVHLSLHPDVKQNFVFNWQ